MSLSDGFFESGSQQVGPNGCDHKGAKVVLVPAHIFIDDCPFFWGFAVILLEVGVGFAEVGHDSTALPKNEVTLLDDWYFAHGMHVGECCLELFSFEEIDTMEGGGYFGDCDECVDCSGGL